MPATECVSLSDDVIVLDIGHAISHHHLEITSDLVFLNDFGCVFVVFIGFRRVFVELHFVFPFHSAQISDPR